MDRRSILNAIRGVNRATNAPVPTAPVPNMEPVAEEVPEVIRDLQEEFRAHPSRLPLGGAIRGKSTPWEIHDTEELFLANSKKYPGKMAYSDKDIVYDFNSYGYRSAEPFTGPPSPSIVYMGCSFTEGVGLPVKDIWPTLLHNKIEEHMGCSYAHHNLGVGGASNDSIARRALAVGMLNPVLVVILYTFLYRREYISIPGGVIQSAFAPWNPQATSILEQGDANNDAYNFLQNKSLIELSAQSGDWLLMSTVADSEASTEKGILADQSFFVRTDPWAGSIPRARDMAHPGSDFHVKLAEEFFTQLLGNGTLKSMQEVVKGG